MKTALAIAEQVSKEEARQLENAILLEAQRKAIHVSELKRSTDIAANTNDLLRASRTGISSVDDERIKSFNIFRIF